MFKLKRAGILIYVIYLNSMSLIWNADIELYSTEIIKIQLLKKYKDYADVFLEKEADKMPDFIYCWGSRKFA